jgi:ubiquinone/menaquinone biosynthesis C-methylase UbiE
MTAHAPPEYVTDVAYVRSVENDLSPVRLRLAAALNGFRPPPAEDFDYCELGSAHGDTTATLAAAYPRARFVGVDLNPDHIASANALARGGRSENLRFLECDFEDLLGEDLPDFDFIAAHGVLSWVGPKKRKAILDFASAKLKPGGILHVSYNALPGWAPIEPLRQLILARAMLSHGNSLERARHGLDFAKLMNEKGAEYFTSNPAAKTVLATMEKHGLPYVVHEYLHAHWVPMYFAQVASEMAASDLYFIGQLPLYLNYRDVAIPQSLTPLFQSIEDRVTFESLKDFALNEYFRRDLYIKGRIRPSAAATQAYVDTTAFGTLVGEGPIQRDVRLPHHTLHYVGAIFDALLPVLEEGATPVAALASRPELSGFDIQRIRDAILRLALGAQVSPMQRPTRAVAAFEGGVFRVPSAHNRWVLQQGLSSESPVVLASTAAGVGIEIPTIEVVAILLLTEVPPARREEWVRALCNAETFRLTVRNRSIAIRKEQEQILLDEVEQFRTRRLSKLLELGILDEVAPALGAT